MKRALQRALAQQDIVKAFDYYLAAASASVAADFVTEIDACMQRIEQFPQAGSPRYVSMLNVEGVRLSVVERFPYLVFFLNARTIRILYECCINTRIFRES